MVLIAKCIASRDILNSDDRGDVARITGFDVFAFVGLDLNQTRDAFALVGPWIVNVVALAQRARENTEENELSDKWIAPKFEREGAEVPIIVCRRFQWFVRVRFHSFG